MSTESRDKPQSVRCLNIVDEEKLHERQPPKNAPPVKQNPLDALLEIECVAEL